MSFHRKCPYGHKQNHLMASKLINNRVNFASVRTPMPTPDFLDVQLKSFQDFLQLDTPPELRKYDGLYKVFSENFPITDTRNNFVLEFLDYFIDPPRYSIDECLVGWSVFHNKDQQVQTKFENAFRLQKRYIYIVIFI